jgi:hypothetical protein
MRLVPQKTLLSLLLLQFAVNFIESATCPTSCLHLGTVNTAQCKCDCYSAYSGLYCERAIANCATSQPTDCGTNLPVEFCIFESIAMLCPQMCSSKVCTCGLDTCLNFGVFHQSSCSCQCPPNYYGEVCQFYTACPIVLTCTATGTFNPTTCICDCQTGYTGPRCETLITTIAPVTVAPVTVAPVTVAPVTVAPVTIAPVTVAPVTTVGPVTVAPVTVAPVTAAPVTSCQPLACQNGFTFNAATCSCKCGTGFTGSLCETYVCSTLPVPDSPTLCPLLAATCSDASTKSACPFMCLCGGTTAAPTVAPVTLAPVVTSCQPLACKYGFVFNTGTCSCPCPAGFSGTLCETYNCATVPDPAAVGLCAVLTCGPESISATCPNKCLCPA